MNDRTLINPSRNRQTVVNGSAGVLPDFTGRTINDTYIADRTFEESSGEAVSSSIVFLEWTKLPGKGIRHKNIPA